MENEFVQYEFYIYTYIVELKIEDIDNFDFYDSDYIFNENVHSSSRESRYMLYIYSITTSHSSIYIYIYK